MFTMDSCPANFRFIKGVTLSSYEANAATAEVVAQYLQDHPDFFKERQALVEKLSLPLHQEGAVSLVEVQLKRQRQKIAQLEEEITELMSIANGNGQNFHQFMELQEKILSCDTLNQVISTIETFAKALSLTGYVKLLDHRNPKFHINQSNWQRFATNHLNGKPAYLGRFKKADRDLLFADDRSPELGSFVVLPLEKKAPLGIIAFSSEDGGHFQPEMDTFFLRHLAITVSHLVATLEWDKGVAHVGNHPPA